ncbi:Uncharacterised protein at_DN0451 [Pycnogonum litorale]
MPYQQQYVNQPVIGGSYLNRNYGQALCCGMRVPAPVIIFALVFGIFIFFIGIVMTATANAGRSPPFDDEFFRKHDDENPVRIIGPVFLTVGFVSVLFGSVTCCRAKRSVQRGHHSCPTQPYTTAPVGGPPVQVGATYPTVNSSYCSQVPSYPTQNQPVVHPPLQGNVNQAPLHPSACQPGIYNPSVSTNQTPFYPTSQPTMQPPPPPMEYKPPVYSDIPPPYPGNERAHPAGFVTSQNYGQNNSQPSLSPSAPPEF